MKIYYTIPLLRKIIIDDHWPIPIQGGKLKVIEENGFAKALEISFENQPVKYAPHFQPPQIDGDVATIRDQDAIFPLVKRQLDGAFSFLECIFDVTLDLGQVATRYEAESPEEDSAILVKSFSTSKHEPILPLTFDMITRSIMAAEYSSAPKFEATLAKSARKALSSQEFINSFRYSFLLIESLYGKGQFKKEGLKYSLKSDHEFLEFVNFAIKDMIPALNDSSSITAKLLSKNPTSKDVIDHLVDRRGFYFHGNVLRKDSWKPEEQGEAESLALLSISIISQISMKAAEPMFLPDFSKRHFDDAMNEGAKLVFEVEFTFRNHGEEFPRKNRADINFPGKNTTPRASFEIGKYCLELFQHNQPSAALLKVECYEKGANQKIFEFTFHDFDTNHL